MGCVLKFRRRATFSGGDIFLPEVDYVRLFSPGQANTQSHIIKPDPWLHGKRKALSRHTALPHHMPGIGRLLYRRAFIAYSCTYNNTPSSYAPYCCCVTVLRHGRPCPADHCQCPRKPAATSSHHDSRLPGIAGEGVHQITTAILPARNIRCSRFARPMAF